MTASGSQHPLALFAPLPGRPGQPIPITGTAMRIGQGTQNDVVLDDDTVSTSHARLELADGAWRLTDLESRNGTFVAGERLPSGGSAVVAADTPVAFGAVKLVFSLETAGVVPPPPPTATSRPAVEASQPARLADRPGFRLPVWALLLIIVVIAIIVVVVMNLGGGEAPAAMMGETLILLAFESAGSIS